MKNAATNSDGDVQKSIAPARADEKNRPSRPRDETRRRSGWAGQIPSRKSPTAGWPAGSVESAASGRSS